MITYVFSLSAKLENFDHIPQKQHCITEQQHSNTGTITRKGQSQRIRNSSSCGSPYCQFCMQFILPKFNSVPPSFLIQLQNIHILDRTFPSYVPRHDNVSKLPQTYPHFPHP